MSAAGQGEQQAAALPWAAVELPQSPPEPDLPANELGLGLGARIEARAPRRWPHLPPLLPLAAACLPNDSSHSQAPCCLSQVWWSIHLEQEGGEETTLNKVRR